MDPLFFAAAAASIAFYVFLGWGLLSHVKEQRRQSAILARMVELLEKRGKDN